MAAQHVPTPAYLIQLTVKDNLFVIQTDVLIHSSELAEHAQGIQSLASLGLLDLYIVHVELTQLAFIHMTSVVLNI